MPQRPNINFNREDTPEVRSYKLNLLADYTFAAGGGGGGAGDTYQITVPATPTDIDSDVWLGKSLIVNRDADGVFTKARLFDDAATSDILATISVTRNSDGLVTQVSVVDDAGTTHKMTLVPGTTSWRMRQA